MKEHGRQVESPAAVQCLWRSPEAARPWKTGVSLHSHTSHSREYLDFIPRVLSRVPLALRLLRWFEKRHSERPDKEVHYRRGYWRPPLLPLAAYEVEASQINSLGLRPIVSITDHDDLEACVELCAIGVEVPYSLEWSVPYHQTMFHIGVHNLPAAQARSLEAAMASCTANPTLALVREMFAALDALPDALLVLNHPYSNEERVDRPTHVHLLDEFLRSYRPWLHAIELNGLQPASDNRQCIRLAAQLGLPVISGGDRHCLEPNANINLTNACSFAEFVSEVRHDGLSHVLFMPQYRDPIPARYIEFIWHAVQTYPDFAGRERLEDRIFIQPEDGPLKTLSQKWPSGSPAFLRFFIAAVEFLAAPRMRGTLRQAFGGESEIGA
jgi:hypothetical protein